MQETIQQLNVSSSSSRKYVELCCYLLYHTHVYKPAADYFNWLISTGQGDIGFWRLLSAHCAQELGDYQSAKKLLDEVCTVEIQKLYGQPISVTDPQLFENAVSKLAQTPTKSDPQPTMFASSQPPIFNQRRIFMSRTLGMMRVKQLES